MSKTGTYTVYI
jgi:hypothetical protein